jgi:hypothetical protein
MYTTNDTDTMLALARQRQDDVKRGFPRKLRKHGADISLPATFAAPVARIDVGALSIPAPRQPDREKTVA